MVSVVARNNNFSVPNSFGMNKKARHALSPSPLIYITIQNKDRLRLSLQCMESTAKLVPKNRTFRRALIYSICIILHFF